MRNIDANEKYGNGNEKYANEKRSESTSYVVKWEILMQMRNTRMEMRNEKYVSDLWMKIWYNIERTFQIWNE